MKYIFITNKLEIILFFLVCFFRKTRRNLPPQEINISSLFQNQTKSALKGRKPTLFRCDRQSSFQKFVLNQYFEFKD